MRLLNRFSAPLLPNTPVRRYTFLRELKGGDHSAALELVLEREIGENGPVFFALRSLNLNRDIKPKRFRKLTDTRPMPRRKRDVDFTDRSRRSRKFRGLKRLLFRYQQTRNSQKQHQRTCRDAKEKSSRQESQSSTSDMCAQAPGNCAKSHRSLR